MRCSEIDVNNIIKTQSEQSKEAHLRNFPVKVTYKVKKINEPYFLATLRYAIILQFYNYGSESVDFILFKIAAVDYINLENYCLNLPNPNI